MKLFMPILIVAATLALLAAGIVWRGQGGETYDIDAGSAVPGLVPAATTPEQSLDNLLWDLSRHDWHAAFSQLANSSDLKEANFVRELSGSHGSLRTLSGLQSWEVHPLHQSADEAQMRVVMHWSSAVGPLDDVRDLQLLRRGNIWRVVWPKPKLPDVPAQVIPVNYLRWDLVSAEDEGEWGQHNVDAPHVRVLSMNAVPYEGGSVVIGEVVNEDTIPAFVNVEATLVDGAGNPIDEESSFDKILHVLLPKQVSPYRIDFPNVPLAKAKSVRISPTATLVPAAADPVIGVSDQKLETDALGHSVLVGDLVNPDGTTVNIPHVIASFYDNSGRVIWVGDGYVTHALLPTVPEPFAVEIPQAVAGQVHSYHVVVNQYTMGAS